MLRAFIMRKSNFSELIFSSNCLWSFTLVSKDVPRFYDKVMDFLTIVVVRSTSEQSGKKPLQLLVTPNDLTTELWNEANRELYEGHGGCNVVNIALRDPYIRVGQIYSTQQLTIALTEGVGCRNAEKFQVSDTFWTFEISATLTLVDFSHEVCRGGKEFFRTSGFILGTSGSVQGSSEFLWVLLVCLNQFWLKLLS